ncbi:MAG TPA: DsbA family protein [Solirubrobacteraceae bacterium]
MGTVTSLELHRIRRRGAPQRLPRATLYFDLASPHTYLAAERAERLFAGLEWRPAYAEVLHCADLGPDGTAAVTARAALLSLPLVWPDNYPYPFRAAMRVAALASELGCAAAFVLAASRLAFCGGYDIDDPEILAEAAAAAGIGLAEALQAAGDAGRDEPIEEVGRLLLTGGAQRLPVLRVGRLLFCGEDRLLEAAAARAAV